MKQLKTWLFLSLILSAAKSIAHQPEEGKVTAVFAPYYYRTHVPDRYRHLAPLHMGGGMLIEGDVDENGGLEIGMIYLPKYYLRSHENQVIVERIKRLSMTLGYRHWFNHHFSGGLSWYTNYSLGNPEVTYLVNPSALPLQTSARKATEHGIDFSIQWQFWQHEGVAFQIDTRYSLSMTARKDEKANQYGAFIGFRTAIDVK